MKAFSCTIAIVIAAAVMLLFASAAIGEKRHGICGSCGGRIEEGEPHGIYHLGTNETWRKLCLDCELPKGCEWVDPCKPQVGGLK